MPIDKTIKWDGKYAFIDTPNFKTVVESMAKTFAHELPTIERMSTDDNKQI